MNSQPPGLSGRPAVLSLVKREGPVAADDLARRLGLTTVAVRQHLQALLAEGLVASLEGDRPRARGRPARLWRATAAADARFADAHAGLALDLIGQMRRTFGEEGLDRLLKLRTAEQAAIYREAIDAGAPLAQRLEALAKVRDREGYMAEVRDQGDGVYLFLEHHCPVCAAATICTGLCREEIALFTEVLGPEVQVERISHILAGAVRCAYRVQSAPA
jgi:predicted ArsR family transcriptional regulator